MNIPQSIAFIQIQIYATFTCDDVTLVIKINESNVHLFKRHLGSLRNIAVCQTKP